MGDIDISGALDNVTMTEDIGPIISTASLDPSVSDATSLAESVSTPVMAVKLYRGTQSVTVSLVTIDWALVETFRQYRGQGVPLKGIILIPGSGAPDTFCIKDGSDTGSYLYKKAVSAAEVIVYPGSLCKPYIDYSECTLSAGHLVTFVW